MNQNGYDIDSGRMEWWFICRERRPFLRWSGFRRDDLGRWITRVKGRARQ